MTRTGYPGDSADAPERLAFSADPFDHFVWRGCLAPVAFAAVQREVGHLEWQPARSEEYLKDHSTHASTERLLEGETGTRAALAPFRSEPFIRLLNGLFAVQSRRLTDVVYLRMRSGFYNHVHSDENDFGELVRLILYISDEREYQGGGLVLHRDSSGQSASHVFRFPGNTMFGFRMDGRSWHSVDEVTGGERVCLSLTYS